MKPSWSTTARTTGVCTQTCRTSVGCTTPEPSREITHLKIYTGVLQGNPLVPYMFITILDYALRTGIADRRRCTRHPDCHLSDMDNADDICSLTQYKKQNVYFIKWKVFPNLLDYFSIQAKQILVYQSVC